MTEAEKPKVAILDAPMGSGKTYWIIDEIRKQPKKRYIFVSPLLTEVGDPDQNIQGRIPEELPELNFRSPGSQPTKGKHLTSLLDKRLNVSCTHELYERINSYQMGLINKGQYVLIIDETLKAVSTYKELTKDDSEVLKDQIEVDQDSGKVSWIGVESGSRFEEVKRFCDEGRLYKFNDIFYMTELPISLIKSAERIVILTYLFKGSIMEAWLKANNIEYALLPTKNLRISENDFKKRANELIELVEPRFSKEWGEKRLNVTGYKAMQEQELKGMSKQLSSYCKKTLSAKSSEIMWTCFSDQKDKLKGAGYAKGWVACNARATNKYADKTVILYLIDRHINPNYRKFFDSRNIVLDGDLYALSEMVQFIWRSAIREGKEIKLFIPSNRMREILKNWLKTDQG